MNNQGGCRVSIDTHFLLKKQAAMFSWEILIAIETPS